MKKRSDGRYQSRVTLPDGTVKTVYGRTKQELNDNKDELKLAYAMGATNIDKKITVQEWAEKWWKVAKEGKTGNSSQRGYALAMNNYIFPEIGSTKLKDIKPIHVQKLINDIGEKGKSKSIQRQVLVALNGMFKYAVRNGLMIGNPAQYTEYYDVPVHDRESLTTAQTTKLLEVCSGLQVPKGLKVHRAELAVHLAMYCGLRRGEITAVKWADLDDATQTIHVKNSTEFIHNRPKDKDTKSKAGKRIIPVPPHLWSMIQSQPKKSLFIVPSARGVQMSEVAVRRLMEPVQRRVDFHVTLHILRHTYATLIDRMGISPKTCQYLLGHAELSTTKDIYTHIQDEHITMASEQLRDIYLISQQK